ncbi:anhydro-N-acetylmuramic acid kinase [Oceanicoccus sagamiensis]|uniref:Anhydro-N-acetylmuramic acid kinase n=1 Tax=Oceanicoccus sagamiensis TaxID=716816 RepID=A0A1X9N8P6_9GAMM|nr:anhydro-N-acetylmuramic acid kinase [Oceanicoccus sagamiensis]ARN74430.1 anhydro-N-acetylmuramic acid kinase [Oceanicoccus sagamiensis]
MSTDRASSSNLYIGLMSGTSLDSIDAAVIELSDQSFQLIDSIDYHIPEQLRQQLISLCLPGDNEIDRMGEADRALGHEFAKATKALLKQSQINPKDIRAIGSHGQTIRHRPQCQLPFTLQIGDANTIAYETGITTVTDFRRKDMAAGGQGAPLAPGFHQAAFASKQHNRAIINIGGMANITYLGSNGDNLAFDTGPGNILMDSWINKHQQKNYDKAGEWAATGKVNTTLLAELMSHPYLQYSLPKSTGREDFNLPWLEKTIGDMTISAEDIQATLLEFTAQTLNDEINKLPGTANEVYICGGGAYNSQLMLRLEALAHPKLIANTSQLGVPAEWVEAAAFAWLAKQTLERNHANLVTATGAKETVILGAVYYV